MLPLTKQIGLNTLACLLTAGQSGKLVKEALSLHGTSAASLCSMQMSKTSLIWPPVLSYYSNNIKTCVSVCVSTECPSDHHRKLAYGKAESGQREAIVHLEGHMAA